MKTEVDKEFLELVSRLTPEQRDLLKRKILEILELQENKK